MRSTAICTPTSAVLPPDAAVPDRGWSVPILKGLACWPNADRHGAGISMVAPRAPAAPADSPRNRRRVVLPLHHMSRAQIASCRRSAIVSPPARVSECRPWSASVRVCLYTPLPRGPEASLSSLGARMASPRRDLVRNDLGRQHAPVRPSDDIERRPLNLGPERG